MNLLTSNYTIPLFCQKILAHEPTLQRPSHELKKLNQPLTSPLVDFNLHQINAALFAFNCPLSRGAILCDEVDLGKTIEAGLIISQLWAEGKRKIIIVVPASLRKQWQNELLEKFNIPCVIVDGSEYKISKKDACNPFDRNNLAVIVSIPFAFSKRDEIKAEKKELSEFKKLAEGIQKTSKGEALT